MRREKKYYIFLSGVLIIIFFISRLWKLTSIPSGLHIDEASMAYSAWSLSQFGVDRYLKSWPVYLINFDGGQSSLYCFLCAALFKLFGYHTFLIRIPSVLFSFLTFTFGTLIIQKIYSNSSLYLSLFGGLLITICPYFILAGRFGLDCNLLLGMSTVFLFCFITATTSQKYRWYILSGITGGLVLYTYALSYIILPVFLILSLLYVIWTKKFSFRMWLAMAIPLGILAFPLLLEQYINIFNLEEIQLGIFTVTKMKTYRASEIGSIKFIYLLQALISIFKGDVFLYNSIPGFDNLYTITKPFFLLGFLHVLFSLGKMLYKRLFSPIFYLLFWFSTILLLESCLVANTNKVNGIFFSVVFLAIDGINLLMNVFKKYNTFFILILSCLYLFCFVKFGTYYYMGDYAKDSRTMLYFDNTISEAVLFLDENPQYRNKGTYLQAKPIYYALSALKSPYELRLDLDKTVFYDYWHCSELPAIEDGYNYIIHDYDIDYANDLRQRGFIEKKFDNYSLFISK